MPTEVFESTIQLQIGLIEAEIPPLGGGAEYRASYPYPFLKPTPQSELREFRTVVLENSFLRATIIPALGGRIVELIDRRTGRAVLELPASLRPEPGGPRGARLRQGLQLRYDGHDRLGSLGYVETLLDGESGVWIGEVSARGLSLNALMSMPDDRAELRIEARVFNRGFAPVAYDGGLVVHCGEAKAIRLADGVAWYDATRDVGMAVQSERVPFDSCGLEDGELTLSRFGSSRRLPARQLDAWTVVVAPISGLGGLSAASSEAAAFLGDGVLRTATAAPQPASKLVLLLESGQTMEATEDLTPNRVTEINLEGLPSPAVGLVILSAHREELLRFEPGTSHAAAPTIPEAESPVPIGPELDERTLRRAAFDPARRHVAHVLLGMRALASGLRAEAAREFEESLLFDAEDHLAWWAKAVVARLLGDADEERPELLNAHYLAPLEPALRAEAFLSQPQSGDRAPSAMLRPMEENPESFVEVACLLVELGLLDEATRWIDESLRHIDLPMLRYLQAHAYHSGSRMTVEAAEQVAAAGRLPFAPPFPWRPVEIGALRSLRERYPADKKLARWADLTTLAAP